MIDKGQRNKKSDYWALGVLAYMLSTKKLPFMGKNITELFFSIIEWKLGKEINMID